jgi:hypothetical protein
MSLLCLVLALGFTLILRLKSDRIKRPCACAHRLCLLWTCGSLVFLCMNGSPLRFSQGNLLRRRR